MRLVDRAEHVARATLPTPALRRAYQVGWVVLRAWWRVRRPRVEGVKCVVRQGDRVLLVRHSYGRRGAWDLPGGFLAEGEAPEDGARRELAEELQLEPRTFVLLGAVQTTIEGKRDTIHVFAVDVDGDGVTADAAEIAEVGWFDHAALPSPTASFTRRLVARAWWEMFRG